MRRSAALPPLLLLACAALLYRKSTRLWWTYDDPWFLHVALGRRWTEGFTHPDIWRQNLYTPLLTATYEAFVAIFGLEPARWFSAQIAIMGLVACAVYFALRLYVDPTAAFGGALLFLVSPPIASVATNLGVIHYFEAILLGTLAAIAYVLSVRRDRLALSTASAFLYLLAMLAKEIAVPLLAILALLPEGTVRRRVRHLVPPALALAAYTIWRLVLIGVPLRGYGWATEAGDLPQAIAGLPWKLAVAASGASLAIGLAAIGLALAGASMALRTWQRAVLALAALALAIAPIVPVSREMQDRYALLPWLWLSALFTIGIARLKWRAMVIALVVIAAVIANRQEWAAEFARSIRMSDEARVWVAVGGDALLRKPAIPPGTMPELQWLKEDYIGHDRGSVWFYDDFYLCVNPVGTKRVWEYSVPQRMVVDVTDQIPAIARRYCSSLRNDAPMRAEFHYRDGTLHWRLGPYREGRWGIILFNGEHAFEVPADSRFHLFGDGIALRVRYQSPEGWTSYSPEIAIDFKKRPDVVWGRPRPN